MRAPRTPVHLTGPLGPKKPVFEPTLHLAWTNVHGHADYKSMKPYIDIAEKAKTDAVDAMEKAPPDEAKVFEADELRASSGVS